MRTNALQLGVLGLYVFTFNLLAHAKDVCRGLSFTFGDPSASLKDEPPVWDLDGIYGYSGPEDLRIEEALTRATTQALLFKKNYAGKIKSKRLSAQQLLAAIKNYEAILAIVQKVEVYAFAMVTVDVNDTKAQSLQARVDQTSSEISSQLAFFEWELSQADRAHIQKLLTTGKLEAYRHFIEKTLERGPYQLPTREAEEMLATLSPHLEATSRVRNNFDANLGFPFQKPGEAAVSHLTAEELRGFIKDNPDPGIRRTAQETLLAVYHQHRKLFADLYSEFVRTQITLRQKLRKYPHPAFPRHLSNELDPADVDRLVQSVVARYPLVRRHWELKRRALGLSSMTSADIDAPLLKPEESPPKLTWAEIRQTALDAAAPYAPPELLRFLDETCLGRCVHAKSTPGKEKGGYMATSVPGIPPIVLMHFNGTPWDLHVLVHELIIGHGFDYLLRSDQSLLNFGGGGMFRGETASTFAELLLLDHRMKKGEQDDRTKLRTLMTAIDEINTTIFREIVYYLFELDVYAHVEKHGRIDADTLEQIWMKRYREYFGDVVTPVNHFEALWAFPVHFYEPFYVYAYTAGQLAGIQMFLRLMKDPGYFAQIMAAYRRGSSAPVKTIYREDLGIDLDHPQIWDPAHAYFEKLIDDEAALIEKISSGR